MKRTTIFFIVIIAVLALSVLSWQYIQNIKIENPIARIYKDDKCIKEVNLSEIEKPYDFVVGTDNSSNTIHIEEGRICVSEATCPDKVCVKQGYISDGAVPIVCLPNKLVIKIESGKAEMDAVSK